MATDASGEGWLSRVLDGLWPYIVSYAEKMLTEVVQLTVQASLPRGFRSFKFLAANLGHENPPRVYNVRIVEDSADETDQVRLKFRLEYDASPDIRMNIATCGSFGVAKLTMRGTVGVVLRPLVNEIPFFGAVQVYFTKQPDIHLELNGVASITKFPFVKRALSNAIEKTVADLFVLPNIYVTKMVEQRGLFRKLHIWPLGLCTIRVIEARKLINKDNISHSDPYAIVELGSRAFTSSTIQNSLDPVWPASDYMDCLITTTHQALNIHLLDKDKGKKDDELGMASVQLADVLSRPCVWIPVNQEGGQQGEVCVSAELMELTPANTGSFSSKTLLTVLVERATFLPENASPYVQVKVNGEVRETFAVFVPNLGEDHNATVLIDPSHPRWEQVFDFILPKSALAASDTIEFTLKSKNALLGTAKVEMHQITSSPTSELAGPIALAGSADDRAELYVDVVLHNLTQSSTLPREQLDEKVVPVGQDWINIMVSKMWPSIALYSESLLRSLIPPIVNGMLPKSFGEIRLTKVELGPKPVVLKDLIVEKSQDCVSVVAHMSYDGNPEIVIASGLDQRFTVGIRKLKLSGRTMIRLKPMSAVPPFFSVMQVTFMNPPDLELDFTGLADIADWGIMKQVVRDAIDDQVRALIVAPNHLMVKLNTDQTIPWFYQAYIPPRGLLRINVVSAGELVQMDYGSSSDPYVRLCVGATLHRSSTINNNVNPIWPAEEGFDFLVMDERQDVLVEVWDEDYMKLDNSLGRGTTTVQQLIRDKTSKVVLSEVDSGSVFLTSEFSVLERESSDGSRRCLITLLVQGADGLPSRVDESATMASIRARLGDEEQITFSYSALSPEDQAQQGVVMDASCPVWEVPLYFVVDDVASRVLTLEVVHRSACLSASSVIIAGRDLVKSPNLCLDGPWSVPLVSGGNCNLYARCFASFLSEKN